MNFCFARLLTAESSARKVLRHHPRAAFDWIAQSDPCSGGVDLPQHGGPRLGKNRRRENALADDERCRRREASCEGRRPGSHPTPPVQCGWVVRQRGFAEHRLPTGAERICDLTGVARGVQRAASGKNADLLPSLRIGGGPVASICPAEFRPFLTARRAVMSEIARRAVRLHKTAE